MPLLDSRPKYDAPPFVIPNRTSLTRLDESVDRSDAELSGRVETYLL